MLTPDTLSITDQTDLPSQTSSQPLTSTTTEICSTIRSSNSFLSYRQPYLGWRTQERLKLSTNYLNSPSQRLACTLLNQGQKQLHRLVDS